MKKWALGAAANRWAPSVQSVDYFGFGYLLPTLLAIKMWNTDRIATVVMPTLQVSVVAFALGNLLSFGMRFVQPAPSQDSAGSALSVALGLVSKSSRVLGDSAISSTRTSSEGPSRRDRARVSMLHRRAWCHGGGTEKLALSACPPMLCQRARRGSARNAPAPSSSAITVRGKSFCDQLRASSSR